jgi:hypothetical protein
MCYNLILLIGLGTRIPFSTRFWSLGNHKWLAWFRFFKIFTTYILTTLLTFTIQVATLNVQHAN